MEAQRRPRHARGEVALREIQALLFVALVALRLSLCFAVPLETTDAYRNLGYARHAFDAGGSVYDSVAADHAAEAWSEIWSDLGFLYGPVVLVFFWAFGAAGLGLVWVKLALTAVDLGVAAIFSREASRWAGLVYFAAPIGLWFVSHEGEHDSLQTLWIALAAVAARRGRWAAAGAGFALAAQTKAFGVLLLPWLVLEWWRRPERKRELWRFVAGGALATLPFAGFYLEEPLLLLHPIRRSIDASYNPFAWNVLDRARFLWNPPWLIGWNALASYAALATAIAFAWRRRRERDAAALLPFALFWCVTKSLRWAQFWYPVAAPGFLLCLDRRRRSWLMLLLLLHAFQDARGATMLLGSRTGFLESPRHRAQMQACLLRCPPQASHGEPGPGENRRE